MKYIILIMSWQILNSSITIGTFQFAGVHEVRVKRNMNSLIETATIVVPSIATYVPKGKKTAVTTTTGTLFKDGDPVTIQLGYNGALNTEFQGFVKRRDLNMPLTIECEGYSYVLRQNSLSGLYKSIDVKTLLEKATAGTGITVQCNVSATYVNVPLNQNNGLQICDFIKNFSDGALTCFFINPTTLWCGLPYTAIAGGKAEFGLPQVNYELGYNTIKDNGLKERIPSDPVQVILNGKFTTEQRVFTQSMYKSAKRKLKSLLNHVADNGSIQQYAQEKEYLNNYVGYEGNINAFLMPFCGPGYMTNVVDDRYKERNGVYLVEGVDVTYGVKGARRSVNLGPQLNFGQNYLNALTDG
jgi:hypothetical protein